MKRSKIAHNEARRTSAINLHAYHMQNVVLMCSIFQTTSQCYLEDARATCVACWRTLSDGRREEGRACREEDIAITWDTPPPEKMFHRKSYPVAYTLTVAENHFRFVARPTSGGEFHDIVHSNIHSCDRSYGACTPFVKDSPGMSTHTGISRGNFSEFAIGGSHVVSFETNIKLPRGQYTIISHNRFWVWEAACSTFASLETCPNSRCKWHADDAACQRRVAEDMRCDGIAIIDEDALVKYDVAVGVARDVVRRDKGASTDAIVGTAIVAFLVLISVGSVAYAARQGTLDIDKILAALSRAEVTLTVDVITGIGDAIAFTMCVFEEVFPNGNLSDILPLCFLVLFTAWSSSLFMAGVNLRQLYLISMSHRDHNKFLHKLLKYVEADLRSMVDSKQFRWVKFIDQTTAVMETPEHATEILTGFFDGCQQDQREIFIRIIQEYADVRRQHRQSKAALVTIFLEDMPITAVTCFVLLRSGADVEVITVLALLFSSVLLGTKFSTVASMSTLRPRLLESLKQLYPFIASTSVEMKTTTITSHSSNGSVTGSCQLLRVIKSSTDSSVRAKTSADSLVHPTVLDAINEEPFSEESQGGVGWESQDSLFFVARPLSLDVALKEDTAQSQDTCSIKTATLSSYTERPRSESTACGSDRRQVEI